VLAAIMMLAIIRLVAVVSGIRSPRAAIAGGRGTIRRIAACGCAVSIVVPSMATVSRVVESRSLPL
jgi:hypothetical protein